MQQLNPQQLVEHIESCEKKPLLIDVREESEVAICVIDGSTNIPLQQLPSALDLLDPDQEYVLICHHGIRSQRACDFLYTNGFTRLINLAGGIDAWASDIAPEMQCY